MWLSERGQSLVELAISFTILMYLLAGAVEFGIAFFQFVQLRDAAQEGALFGSIYPDNLAEIESRVRNSSSTPINLTSPDVKVVISFYNGVRCEGGSIRVRVEHAHKIFMPFMPQLLNTDVIVLRGDVTDTILRPVCK